MEVISDFAALPDFERILTADGGPLDLRTPSARGKQAVLLLRGNPNRVVILRTENATGLEVVTLRNDAEEAGYKVVATCLATSQILLDIDNSARRVSRPDDTNYDEHKAVQLFGNWLAEAIDRGITDIHVEIRERYATIRMRENGRLVATATEEAGKAGHAVASAFTLLADSNTRNDPSFSFTEERHCIIERNIGEKTRRFRFESFEVLGGLDCVVRVLHVAEAAEVRSLEALGFAPSQVLALNMAARRRHGLIVVCGATSSGKTTTLMALMTLDPDRKEKKIFTIEDPCEYRMHDASQISVRDASEFAAAARRVLRADPDGAMIGEIRGHEVGSVVVTLIQSGHQGRTTLHTMSGLAAVPRIEEDAIGIGRQTSCARGFLSLIVYQVLLPTLCDCARPAGELLQPEYLQQIQDIFKVDDINRVRAARPGGCEKCRGTGLNGRTVAAEVISPTSELLRLLRDGRDAEADEHWRSLRVAGFSEADMTGKTAFEHGLWKVLQGIVDPRDLERELQPFADYALQMPNMSFGSTVWDSRDSRG